MTMATFTLGFAIGATLQGVVTVFLILFLRRRKTAHHFDWAVGLVTTKPAQREKSQCSNSH